MCCSVLAAQTAVVAYVGMVACAPAGPARPLSGGASGPTLAICHGHHRFFMGTSDTVLRCIDDLLNFEPREIIFQPWGLEIW